MPQRVDARRSNDVFREKAFPAARRDKANREALIIETDVWGVISFSAAC